MRRSTTDYATVATQKTAKHLGEMVRSARKARGWSQESLAERARVSPATMNRLEQGGVNIAFGTWLAAFERLGLLSKLDQLRDPVTEAILEGTKTKRPIRSKPSDLDF
ncbi:helix-turn-helix transcriptional regulator [Stenotrophomonas sp. 278]|uniref:helix-turn-helix domain-containing protein n=1 Tax=Stenotrophomonas sp. 278 TaxID=2479851 RepID=UPI001639F0D7|nr:helix-turn-helix transcriptional regulator [Stenotrophomonas sp. 278]